MTGTAKQKLILAETAASHVSLHDYFDLHKANTANITKLLASVQRHTMPVRPVELGIIGRNHLYRRMEAAGGDPRDVHNARRGSNLPSAFTVRALPPLAACRPGRSSRASIGLREQQSVSAT
jgi:hypothetical protein